MTRGECSICGALTEPVRMELYRRLQFEPSEEYASGLRCVDRARCQADVEVMHKADPEHCPAWNIADGQVAVTKRTTPWRARAAAQTAEAPEVRPAQERSLEAAEPTSGQQMGAW